MKFFSFLRALFAAWIMTATKTSTIVSAMLPSSGNNDEKSLRGTVTSDKQQQRELQPNHSHGGCPILPSELGGSCLSQRDTFAFQVAISDDSTNDIVLCQNFAYIWQYDITIRTNKRIYCQGGNCVLNGIHFLDEGEAGIIVDDKSVSFCGVTFYGFADAREGDGARIFYATGSSAHVDLDHCIIEKNGVADISEAAGGVLLAENDATVSLHDCEFYDSSASNQDFHVRAGATMSITHHSNREQFDPGYGVTMETTTWN